MNTHLFVLIYRICRKMYYQPKKILVLAKEINFFDVAFLKIFLADLMF